MFAEYNPEVRKCVTNPQTQSTSKQPSDPTLNATKTHNYFAPLNGNFWHDYVNEDSIQSWEAIADGQFEAAVSNNSNLKVYMSKAKQKRMKKAAIEQASKRNLSITEFNNPPDEDFTECEFRQLEEASEREAAEAAGVAFFQ